MNKYSELATAVINNVGGKENVKSLRHCITRLRFVLKDESIANDEIIKSMKGTIGLVKAAGEYMVVIGEHVPEVYKEVCTQLGLPTSNVKAEVSKEKKSFLDKALGVIRSGLGPTLNIMCASGVLKGILVILQMCGVPAESGICMLANAAGDAFFYCLPVIMGYNVAKHLEIDPFYGLILGASMIYPSIQNVDVSLLGFTVNTSYTSSFLPVLFGLLISAPIYKFLQKKLPSVVKGFMTPLITLSIAFPLTFVVIGPIAEVLSNGMNIAINFIFELSPLVGCTILGGIWQILVMFGIHSLIVMFAFYAVMAGNPSLMLASTWTVCFGIVGILLATFAKSRDQQVKSAALPAAVSAVFGVTEPGMYGIVVPRKVLLGISCIAGACAGLVVGVFNMKIYSYAGMGVIGLLSFLNPENPQFFPIVLAVLVPLFVGFGLTTILYKDEKSTVKEQLDEMHIVQMPVNGLVKNITESSDEAFSSEALGKGIVIFPENGEVAAPVSGMVKTLFPTKHAIGIVADDGTEVLLHIGVNTVNLQGKYFTTHIKQGDRVEAGDPLVSFDKQAIEKEGYSTEVLVTITNGSDYRDIIHLHKGALITGQPVLRIKRSGVR
ncbi:glucose PTS transporter subunit IIA [Dubosiella newyorkensis]|jgi:PTS system beta-glucosides-specific IIC component|uniref:PTS beta-glucoside transporter subunit EIIBCA n=4 Tax=Dubosiella newyorkensis TaxID=1862672 RepID=A0A1U7NKF1_9FIRM|nr:glucose PTS transporter subunit IIA [Dubosiella newyorkensis]MCI9042200.1 PTS transporter subunit EIIC [Dubosiella newyorkensis]OLU44639.1 PTS beta-glucoside transporter subunit EIIBCA [Dubosiella newyorkensis]